MLVRCPKCNFSQPQDQYCAQCGIDMLSFKPANLPVHKKLLKSGLFQFLFVLVLGASVAHLVVNTNQPQQWVQRINRFKTLSVPNTTEAELTETSDQIEKIDDPLSSPPAEVVIEATSQQQVDGFANTNSERSQASASSTVAKTQTIGIKILMIEIDREFLNNLFLYAQSQNFLLTDSGIKAASIPDLMKKINIPFVTLKSTNDKAEIEQIFSQWSGNNRSNEQDAAGLQLDVKSQKKTKDLLSVDIKLSKSSYQSLTTLFEFNFEAVKNSTLLVNGRNLLSEFEFKNQLHNVSPFNIFKSVDFKNEKTEFAILIEIQSQD